MLAGLVGVFSGRRMNASEGGDVNHDSYVIT